MSQRVVLGRRRTATAVALALLLAVVATPAAPAGAHGWGTFWPSHAAVVSPATACAAPQTPQVTVTLTNTSKTSWLGHALIDVRYLDVDAASVEVAVVDGWPWKVSATLQHGKIRVSDAGVRPGGQVIVTFLVSAEPGTYTLATYAKEHHAYWWNAARLGPAATLELEDCTSTLAWTSQPGRAERAPATVPSDSGSPQVSLTDGSEAGVAGVEVTVELRRAGEAVAFGPGTTATAITDADGVATFSDLRVADAGEGYTLLASTTDVDPVPSDPFDVFDDLCAQGTDCAATAGSLSSDDLTVSARGTADGSVGGLSVSVQPLGADDCAAPPARTKFTRLPSEITLFGLDLVGKTVDIRVSKAYDKAVPQNGVAHYVVCAQPQEPETPYSIFPDAYTGEPVGIGEWGYLPDCRAVGQQTACVVSRRMNKGEPVITVFWGSRFTLR